MVRCDSVGVFVYLQPNVSTLMDVLADSLTNPLLPSRLTLLDKPSILGIFLKHGRLFYQTFFSECGLSILRLKRYYIYESIHGRYFR